MRKKRPFIPPIPFVDPPSQEALEYARDLTKKEHKKLEKTVDANLQPKRKQRRIQKQALRKEWWKNNWISMLSLVFAIIAALPVIAQAIGSILKLLGLWS